ncbi:MAG: hypothetical protein ACXWUJ_09670, partial [Allosphingosinicella sp.]
TVRIDTPMSVATDMGDWRSISTRRTSSPRLRGVNLAFLWMFIRSSSPLKLRNLSLLGPGRMNNLWKPHT